MEILNIIRVRNVPWSYELKEPSPLISFITQPPSLSPIITHKRVSIFFQILTFLKLYILWNHRLWNTVPCLFFKADRTVSRWHRYICTVRLDQSVDSTLYPISSLVTVSSHWDRRPQLPTLHSWCPGNITKLISIISLLPSRLILVYCVFSCFARSD